MLQAVDKMTRPFKAIMGGSSKLAKTVKATRDQLKELNRVQADTESFRKLSKDAAIADNALRKAKAQMKALGLEMDAAGRPTAAMTRAFNKADREVDALSKKSAELQRSLGGVKERLQAAGISTQTLRRGQADLREKITSVTAALAKQEAQLKAVSERNSRMAAAQAQYQKGMAARNALLNAGASAMAGGGAILAPVVKTVKDYVTFEDAMLGIARQVEGARDEGGKLTVVYHDMAREIRQLARELPVPTAQIADMVTAGARMEVPRDALIEYTRTVTMMATAFDAVPDEIAESMGKVAKNFRIPTGAIMGLADTINYLDDNAISRGDDIINVLNRVSGVVSGVAMPASDAAALASTLLTLGERRETAGTAINAITQKFAAAEKGSKKFRAAMDEIGLSTAAVQRGMATDATGTLFTVIDAIRKLPSDKRIGVMVELAGMEHSDTLAKLVDKPDELRRQLDLANGAKAQGSMSREFAARQDTVSARWQRLQNQMFNTSSAGGGALRSTLVGLMDTVGRLIDRFNAFAQAHPQLVSWLLKGAASVGALLTVLGALTLALAAAFGPLVIARYGMAMLGIQLGRGVGIATRLAGAFNFLMKTLAFVGRAFLLNPIGLAVTAIALGAYLLIKYWEPIKAFFTGLWARVTATFQGGLGGVLALVANWSLLGTLYNVMAPVLRWFGIDLPARFSQFGTNLLQGLVAGIKSRVSAVRDAISSVGDSVVGWFKDKLGIRSPSRVFAQLGGFTMQGLERGLTRAQDGPLGIVSRVATAMAGIGAGLAIGTGQATAAVRFDTRPPIAAPSRAATAAPPAASAPVVIHIHPPAGADEHLIARLVAERIERLEAQRAARARSRLTDRD
ncbi:phage tail tape measure protein [Ralstonia sp. 25mfcol4.1]|uniref:phage tail tape measure protein n=1 Tax=Ralstonia sp. 25mfcol4.1 TaxID=1761899 RepID=UPI001587840F|nr:phage tail tape measure protein [Ralstonia sp. 25mfcol4.1]